MSVTATAISAGYGHGLVLMSNGHVWGIGDDQWGQFGPAPFLGHPRLINDPGGIVAVAAGEHHSMLLASDGTVWTLGRNEYGQLGDGTISGVGSTFTRTTPQRVIGADPGRRHRGGELPLGGAARRRHGLDLGPRDRGTARKRWHRQPRNPRAGARSWTALGS